MHSPKAITEKYKTRGLRKRYKEDENFKLYWAMMHGLALCPLEKVYGGKQNCPTGAEVI